MSCNNDDVPISKKTFFYPLLYFYFKNSNKLNRLLINKNNLKNILQSIENLIYSLIPLIVNANLN